MEISEIIGKRHSVREYLDKPVENEKRAVLDALCSECSEKSGLKIQVFYDEPKAFSSVLSKIRGIKGVKNYIALFGESGKDESVGYYGEKIVLKAQELSLNTCWVAGTYDRFAVKKPDKKLKLYCVIALGYGVTDGKERKSKSIDELTEVSGETPEKFYDGVKACMLAPTALNLQNFIIKCKDGKVSIEESDKSTYSKLDLGIVKRHFYEVTGISVFNG